MTGVVAALTVALAGLAGPPAGAQEDPGDEAPAPGATLAEVCVEGPVVEVPELGPRACKNIDSGAVLLALLCGETPMSSAQCSALTDGRDVDPASVDDFEAGWVHRALRLQTRLDLAEPWRLSLIPHTHNAGNSTAYGPSVSTADPNQRFSISDQLRMGSRGIEIDLHWHLHPTGTAQTQGRAVVDCHGRSEGVGPLRVHVGCSLDRLAEESLAEVGAFLRTPGNEDEVVLLYLENQLDDDPLAHELAIEAVERQLGDLVARPPEGAGCASMPMDGSRADVLASGHQVLIVGNCGPGGWTDWVHQRGSLWSEGSNTGGYPAFPDCEARRDQQGYDERFIRHWEDLTWLSAMVGTPSSITPEETRAMVRCGVNMIGFDRLLPFDGRLEALVWSWAPEEPAPGAGRCAARDEDGRFHAAECAEPRHHACRDDAGAWSVTGEPSEWWHGFEACQAQGARFAVPPTAWEAELLARATGPADLWLAYADTADEGWTPHLTGAPDDIGPPEDPGDPEDPTDPPAWQPGDGRPPGAGPPPGPPGRPGPAQQPATELTVEPTSVAGDGTATAPWLALALIGAVALGTGLRRRTAND